MNPTEPLLKHAERVGEILEDHSLPAVVIGGLALAAHGYIRFTQDVDLGLTASHDQLEALSKDLEKNGYQVEYRVAGPEDPLGGVIDIITEAGLVQVISYAERFPRVISDALQYSPFDLSEDSSLKIAPITQLVAMKLYAGGIKSKADILEVLRANPEANIDDIEGYCQSCRLQGFSEIRHELEN